MVSKLLATLFYLPLSNALSKSTSTTPKPGDHVLEEAIDDEASPAHHTRDVLDFFTDMYSMALEKQAQYHMIAEDGHSVKGPSSGLPLISRSTPVTVNEIIDRLLLPLHNEIAYVVLHDHGTWDYRHSTAFLDAEVWEGGRLAILSWDVLFGYTCAKDLLHEVEQLRFYLDAQDFRNPKELEDQESPYHWANFHVGSHIGKTLASCMDRCPDPEFLFKSSKEFLNMPKDETESKLIGELLEEIFMGDVKNLTGNKDRGPVDGEHGSTEKGASEEEAGRWGPRVPAYCLDWSDAYLRLDPNDNHTGAMPDELGEIFNDIKRRISEEL